MVLPEGTTDHEPTLCVFRVVRSFARAIVAAPTTAAVPGSKGETEQPMSALQILTIAHLLVVAAGGAQQNELRDFPGATTDLVSPRGDKRLHWDEPQSDRREHRLSLVDVKTGISVTALQFSRSVSVAWAPSGAAFAVTNRASSDSSQCLLFVIGTAALPARRNLSTQLQRSGLVPAQAWTNHHVDCELLEWRDGDVLLLRLRGYGDADPQGFEHRYEYSLQSGFTPVRESVRP